MGYVDVIVLNKTHPLDHYTRGIKHKPIQGQTGVVVCQGKFWVMDGDGKLVRLIETNPNCLLHEGGPKRKGRLYGGANSHGSVRKFFSPEFFFGHRFLLFDSLCEILQSKTSIKCSFFDAINYALSLFSFAHLGYKLPLQILGRRNLEDICKSKPSSLFKRTECNLRR